MAGVIRLSAVGAKSMASTDHHKARPDDFWQGNSMRDFSRAELTRGNRREELAHDARTSRDHDAGHDAITRTPHSLR